MRQILLIVLLLFIVDGVPLKQKREGRPDEEGTDKKSNIPQGDFKAPVGKTGNPGSRDEDGRPVQEKTHGGRKAGVLGQIGKAHIDGMSPKSQSDVDAAKPEDESRQSAKDSAKQEKPNTDKYATEPIAKKPDVGDDQKKPNGPISGSDVGPAEPKKKKLQPKEGQAEPSAKTSNDGEQEPDKKSLSSEKKQKSTGDDSKPNRGQSDTQKVTENNGGDEDDDDDDQDVRRTKSDSVVPPKGDNKETQESVKTIGKVVHPTETSSSGSFVTYFIIAAVVVIIIYLVFHNKKKLMAYVIEGRNTGRARRSRATSGAEYKPLNNPEELMGCRTESA